MAKYEEVSGENQNLFADAVADADLERLLNVKVLSDNGQKEIGKVQKANPLVKYLTSEDVIIIINEDIFDGLEDNQKRLVVDELVTQLGYDREKDKLIISKPDINTFGSILRKYSFPIYETLHESIKSLYDAKKGAENENVDSNGKQAE